ncbi:TPA: hypothetical protein JFP82_002034 [Vibrio cholerae O1]|nr:hypothetical protein [Vibrio cholerae O1]
MDLESLQKKLQSLVTPESIQEALAAISASKDGYALSTSKTLRSLSDRKTEGSQKKSVVRAAAGFQADPELLWIEPGYNLRQEIKAHKVIAFIMSYINGDYVPPIEVTVVELDGKERLKTVEGHHRTVSLWFVKKLNYEIEKISVIPLPGNEVEHLLRQFKSAESDAHTPIELALGYKRLLSYGLTPSEVATKLQVTPAQVGNYMLLLTAPEELKTLIHQGVYPPTNAWNDIREHGGDIALAKAHEYLRVKGAKAEAKKSGTKLQPKDKVGSLKKVKLAPKQILSMGSAVVDIAKQIDIDQVDSEVSVKLTPEMAKVLLSLAAEYEEMSQHNTMVDNELKRLALEAKAKSGDVVVQGSETDDLDDNTPSEEQMSLIE